MTANCGDDRREELTAWVRRELDAGVEELIKSGAFGGMLVEAKPAWAFPYRVLLGKVREQGGPFSWLICGEVPTDSLASSAASTPREALRHFAMKWHLGAARLQDPSVQQTLDLAPELLSQGGERLAGWAEDLYALVADDSLWPEASPPA